MGKRSIMSRNIPLVFISILKSDSRYPVPDSWDVSFANELSNRYDDMWVMDLYSIGNAIRDVMNSFFPKGISENPIKSIYINILLCRKKDRNIQIIPQRCDVDLFLEGNMNRAVPYNKTLYPNALRKLLNTHITMRANIKVANLGGQFVRLKVWIKKIVANPQIANLQTK